MKYATCREEILAVIRELVESRPDRVFLKFEVLDRMRLRETDCSPRTVQAHLASRMCANAPRTRGVQYDDIVRIGRGQYRLL